MNGDRIGGQSFTDRINRVSEVGAQLIHFVNESDQRHTKTACLSPNRLRLWLYARHCIEDDDTTIEDTQTSLNFGGEVNVSRCIYDVNLKIPPEAGHCRRSDRDTSLPLLRHPICDRRAIVHIADAVGTPGVEQYALSRRRLSRVDMSDDANVPNVVQRVLFGHCLPIPPASPSHPFARMPLR